MEGTKRLNLAKQWGSTPRKNRKNTFLPLSWLKITFLKKNLSLTKICIDWLKTHKNFQLGTSPVVSHSLPLKRETWHLFKNYQNSFLMRDQSARGFEENLINNLNPKFSFGINLFEKESLSTQNITDFLSLLVKLRLSSKVNGFFPRSSYDFSSSKTPGHHLDLVEGTNQDTPIKKIRNSERSLRLNHFPFRKLTNTSFGSVKIKSLNLKPKNSNFFQVSQISSFLEQNGGFTQDKALRRDPKTISIFDFFKKQKLIQMLWLTPNSKLALTKVNPLINSGLLHRFALTTRRYPTYFALQNVKLQGKPNQIMGQYPDKLKLMETSKSLTKLWPNQETFSPKNQADLKADMITENKATNYPNEDMSKSYVGSNTKQNIRVYKFKNFPPEEIIYCPYCEVELLPNSIRRYRLGYIEFVSPVTHIWYTASSIPLLLNLSKTMIEGIASCHEALSSGFPPVYKWSYNGESPTSWTFQMQPLKLPINLVPKAEFSDNDMAKKLYYTEIIDEYNSIICPNYKKPFQVYTPSFEIIPNKRISKTNFTMYKKRNKTSFLKNATTNYKENIKKPKNHLGPLDDNSWFFLHRRIPLPSELEIKRPLNLSSNRILNAAAQPSAAQSFKNRAVPVFFKVQSTTALNNNSFCLSKHENAKNTSKKCIQDFSNLSFWKEIFNEFKYLWMFEDLSENSSLISFSKKNWFLAISSSSFANGKKAIPTKKCQIVDQRLPIVTNNLKKKEIINQFSQTKSLKTLFPSSDNTWLISSFCSPKFSFPVLSSTFDDDPLTSAIGKYRNKIMRRFSFLSKISPILSFKTEPWNKTVTEKKVDSPYDPFIATESEKKREWLKLEGFFSDLSKPLSENQKLPDNSISSEAIRQDSNQEHLKPENDLNPLENDSERSPSEIIDNLSLPLVLPFLGKNPDTIEFQSNYSSYQDLDKDPLKFIIDLYTTKQIDGSNSFDLNDNNEFNQFGPNSRFSNASLTKQEQPYSVYAETRQEVPRINFSNKILPNRKWKNDKSDTTNLSLWSKKNLDQNRKTFIRHYLPDSINPRNNVGPNLLSWGAKDKFFGITTRQLYCGDNDIWNNACIYYNGPLTKLNSKSMPNTLDTNSMVCQELPIISNLSARYDDRWCTRKDGLVMSSGLKSFIKTPNSVKELEWNFSLPDKYSEKNNICPSFNPFHMINNNLFSKTHPFFSYPNNFQDELWFNESWFMDFRSNDGGSGFSNPSKLDLSLYDSSINNVQKKPKEQKHEIVYNGDNNFRKLGRNTYYFKLEQMARLEKAFLKNLFYRNKLYTTSIFRNGTLMVPLTESSIFSTRESGRVVSKNDNNNLYATLLKTKQPKVTLQEKNGYFSEKQLYGSSCHFTPDRFILGETGNGQKLNLLTKNHLKNSLWPLKSNIKSSYPKVYQNHFNGIFNENLSRLWFNLENPFQIKKLEASEETFSPIGVSKYSVGDKIVQASPMLSYLNKPWNGKNPLVVNNDSLNQSNSFLRNNQKISTMGVQSRSESKTFLNEKIPPIGKPISITYDFVISRCMSTENGVFKNTPELQTKQLEAETLKSLDIKKKLKKAVACMYTQALPSRARRSKNQNFPAVYRNGFVTKKPFKKTAFLNAAAQFPAARSFKKYCFPFKQNFAKNKIFSNLFLKDELSLRLVRDYQINNDILVGLKKEFFLLGTSDDVSLTGSMKEYLSTKIPVSFFQSTWKYKPVFNQKETLNKKSSLSYFKSSIKLANQIFGFSSKLRKTKQELSPLALLSFDTTQIEFFGSLKIYAKRKFLQISSLTNQTLPIVSLNVSSNQVFVPKKKKSAKPWNEKSTRVFKGSRSGDKNTVAAGFFNKKPGCLKTARFFDEKNIIGAFVFDNQSLRLHKVKNNTNRNQKKKIRAFYNKVIKSFVSDIFFPVSPVFSLFCKSIDKQWQESRPKPNRVLPWKKLQPSLKTLRLTRGKSRIFFSIIKLIIYWSINNAKNLAELRLSKLIITPKVITHSVTNQNEDSRNENFHRPETNLKYFPIKRHQKLVSYAYAIETIQNQKLFSDLGQKSFLFENFLARPSISEKPRRDSAYNLNEPYAKNIIKKVEQRAPKVETASTFSPIHVSKRNQNTASPEVLHLFTDPSLYYPWLGLINDKQNLTKQGGTSLSLSSKVSCFLYLGYDPLNSLNLSNKRIIKKKSDSSLLVGQNDRLAKTNLAFFRPLPVLFQSKRWENITQVKNNKDEALSVFSLKIREASSAKELKKLCSAITKTRSFGSFVREKRLFSAAQPMVKSNQFSIKVKTKSKYDLQVRLLNSQASVPAFDFPTKESRICSKVTFLIQTYFCFGNPTKEPKYLFLSTEGSTAAAKNQKEPLQFQFKPLNPKYRDQRPELISTKDLKTPIFKYGNRGHIFDFFSFSPIGISRKNTQMAESVISPSQPEDLAHSWLGQLVNDRQSLRKPWKNSQNNNKALYPFTKPNHNSFHQKSPGLQQLSKVRNNTYEKFNKKLTRRPLLSNHTSRVIHQKQNHRASKANTNYYACMCQLTSWGSDHGSWILFLKYIRANIYKNDQLLPSYFNKMNFQMMPRTGSIMLQQLLSQLTLVPKTPDYDFSPNLVSKQNSTSPIDTWPNLVTNSMKPNDIKTDKSIKNNGWATEDSIGKNHFIKEKLLDSERGQYFHYNSSFFLSQAKLLSNFNENFQIRSFKSLSHHQSLINYKTFRIMDGFVFFRPKPLTGFSQSGNFRNYSVDGKPIWQFLPSHDKPSDRKVTNKSLPKRKNVIFKSARFNYQPSKSKFFIMNSVTNASNKYRLYAYKIKKPVPYKRFSQSYQLNSPKFTTNWYRLNNLFTYTQTSLFLNKSKQKPRLGLNIPEICGKKSRWNSIKNRCILDKQIFSTTSNEKQYYQGDFRNLPGLTNQKSYRLINNDFRIIKLIYSLIISFQLQFLPVNTKSKPFNSKSKDYKLFDTSFYGKPDRLLPDRPLPDKPLYYYYLSLPVENSSLENLKQEAKPGLLKNLLKSSQLFKPKTEQFINGKSAQLKNYSYLAASHMTPTLSFYSSTQNRVDSNSNKNSSSQTTAVAKTNDRLVRPLAESGREGNFAGFRINRVLAPQLKDTGWKDLCSTISWKQKSFYFPNQKVKIYNILISPLEIPRFRFLNFGFPTTPFDFTESLLSSSFQQSLQNFPSLKAKAPPIISLQGKRWDKIQKWSYIKQVNRSITNFKLGNFVIGNNNFNGGSEDMILRNSQNKFTNTKQKHQNLLVAGLEPVLPINLDAYKGQIQGETLFMKLKEIGKYNFLIKNKNTLFKSLILKMNSSLQPLLFKTSKANTIFLDNQTKQTKNKGFITRKVSNKQLKQCNNDLILKKENPFPYGGFTKSLKLFRKSKQLEPLFFIPKKIMGSDFLKKINKDYIRRAKMCESSGCKLTLDLEFFRTWLFLDSVETEPLNWFNNVKKTCKINSNLMNQKSVLYNVDQAPPMISHFISLRTKDTNFAKPWESTQIGEVFHEDFFPKLLQFYQYRKNFLLKKNFKQRLSFSQSKDASRASNSTYVEFDASRASNSTYGFTEKPAIACQNSRFSYGSTYRRENLIFSQSTLARKYLILLSLSKNQFFNSHQNFHLYNKINGSSKIWSSTYKLLTRTVYQFYDQEGDSKSFYEFKPFGSKASPVVSDLANQFQVNHPRVGIKFRLLTVPQIFDLKDQFNNLNKKTDLEVKKPKTPINLLGPLYYSSQIRFSSNELVFPFLRTGQNQSFRNSYSKINPYSEKFSYNPTYNEAFLKRHQSLSSETLFREENLKVSASYKALLRKAKILEDYPDPDPLEMLRNPENLKYLTLLNCGLPRPIWWNLQTTGLGQQLPFLPLFRDSYISNNKPKTRENFASNKNLETNSLTWKDSQNFTKKNTNSLSRFIWDGNQNQFKGWNTNQNALISPYMVKSSGEKTNQTMAWKEIFSMRDWTKFENNTGNNTNNNSRLSFFTPLSPIVPPQVLSDQKQDPLVSKTTRDSPSWNENSFSHSDNQNLTVQQRILQRKAFQHSMVNQPSQENPEPKTEANNFSTNHSLLGEKDTSFFLRFGNSKSSKRTGTFNYGRNLRKLRLQYLRNFRRLRFIEYLKATYIKPEWMILSLLPVLPPDLRPVIANPRGYITGDLNTHYQNVIYRNNNIEKLLDTFWIPQKFYSKISFYNYQKATNLMLSSPKSYLYLADHLPINKTELNSSSLEAQSEMDSSLARKSTAWLKKYAISKIFSQLTSIPLGFSYENEIPKKAFKTNNSFNYPCFRVYSETPTPLLFNKIRPHPEGTYYEKDKISKARNWYQNNNLFSKTELNNGYTWQLERIISPMFLKFTVIPHFNFSARGFSRAAALFYEKSKNQKINQAVASKLNHQSNNVSKKSFDFTLGFKDFHSKEKKPLTYVYQPNFLQKGFLPTTPSEAQKPEDPLLISKILGFPLNLKNTVAQRRFNDTLSRENNQTDNYLFMPFDKLENNINNHTQERSKIPKSETGSKQRVLYNLHYKSLLKIYNHKSFFGSNIGIATGYNLLVQNHQFEVLDNESRYDTNSKLSRVSPSSGDSFTGSRFYSKRNKMYQAMENLAQNTAVPSLPAKTIRTQALHDSKPLQEMQYSLQKAVDALIDNSQKLQSNVLLRKGRPLKSLSDNLKGKEGRFRQHLLGKRVDYSGRSVIVVGPELKLSECGIPLIMALRLFQPFLILYLIYRFKIASLLATQLIQRKHPMVINLLKKFIETWPILLNRAPTLHRMNIQAFKIKLVQGKAILLHPLVCSSYNADFDGDQMGVHVPITQQARAESWKLLWSINNSIGLASRQPLFLPSQDMVIGNYYLTAPPINQNLVLAMPKTSLPVNLAMQNHLVFGWPQKVEHGFVYQNSTQLNQLSRFPALSRPWVSGFQKLDHYFFSLEEAYQYYLNQAYSLHVNTPVWFYFGMVFETSEREKPIEIMINKSGNSKIITKYYEKQLKRNRILGKNAFYFKTSTPKIEANCLFELANKNSINHHNQTFLSDSAYGFTSVNQNPKSSPNGVLFSNINKIIVSPSQTIFDKNLNPILLNQIIRSTFGRIEFYYEAVYVSRSGFIKTHEPS